MKVKYSVEGEKWVKADDVLDFILEFNCDNAVMIYGLLAEDINKGIMEELKK